MSDASRDGSGRTGGPSSPRVAEVGSDADAAEVANTMGRAALAAAGIGFCRCTLDGRIIDVDHTTLRIWEVADEVPDPSALRDRPMGELFDANRAALEGALRCMHGAAHPHAHDAQQLQVRTRSGTTKWVLYDSFLLTDPTTADQSIQFVLRDISPFKRAEAMAAESMAVLDATLQSMPFDLFALNREGRYIVQNVACSDRWGDVVGKRPEDLGVDEHTLAVWRENNRRALAGEQVRGEEEFVIDGETSTVFNIVGPIRDRGEITGVLGINVDIAQRKQAEQRYRELHDNVPVGVFRVSHEGQLLSVNPAVVQILGFSSADDIQRVPVADLFAQAESRDALLRALRERGAVAEFEIELRRRDGSTLWTSVSAATVRDKQGEVEHFDGILQDISASKRMAEQLRQAAKMKAIGRLAGGIAHDFNNILTGILGHASMMRQLTGADDPLGVSAQAIEQAAERAHELTEQLLGFARKGKYRRISVDVHQTIREVAELLSRTVDRDTRIEIDFGVERATVLGDPGQLHRALLNLAINAIDAMKAGGVLTIATRVVAASGRPVAPSAEQASASPEPDTQLLEIRVIDTGCGIPEAARARIFEPFFTTKDDEGGAGMGLAMVYGIVEHHHGSIMVADRAGGGTEFALRLPLTDRAALEPTPAAPDVRPGSGGVLVVDDEPLVRSAAGALLEGLGYEVFAAESGEQALQLYQQHRGRIALVLLDMVMPQMDGRSCAQALLDIDPEVRILLSTGYALDRRAQEALDAGAKGFIRKPYTYKALGKAVVEALAR